MYLCGILELKILLPLSPSAGLQAHTMSALTKYQEKIFSFDFSQPFKNVHSTLRTSTLGWDWRGHSYSMS